MELKTIKQLNNDEAMELVKSEWKQETMQKYLPETYDFYKTADGFILEITKPNKLSIDKQLWYDDETEAPQINFDNFYYYNEHNCNMIDCLNTNIKDDKKLYFCNTYKTKVSLIGLNDWDLLDGAKERYNVKRELTEDEQIDILALYREQKEQYKTRLEKYFKKYNNKIYASGYWANR